MFRNCLFLSVFLFSASVSAQYDSEKVFTYLEDTYNKHDKHLLDVLITDLEQYLVMFPKNPHAARVQQMLGSVFSEKRKEDEAIASFIKMLCLHPEMSNVAGSSDELRQLIAKNKSYDEKKDWLFGILDKVVSDRPLADAYFQYLSILTNLDQNGLRDWTLDACLDFIEHFPDDPRNEEVLRWMATVYISKKDYREAELMYAKYSFLYPDNIHLPAILVKQGQINYENLREKEKSQLILQKMITDHPNSDAIPDALFLRGRIFADLTNYTEAIADYRRLVDDYPDHHKVVESLERTAEINEKELKNHRATIDVLNELVEKTKVESKGVETLEHIGSLYERELNDYAAAAATYARIADTFPNYDKAPDRLLDAGEISENKLNDYQKAISYYQSVIDKFPSHKKAEDARKKIEKAQEKLNKN